MLFCLELVLFSNAIYFQILVLVLVKILIYFQFQFLGILYYTYLIIKKSKGFSEKNQNHSIYQPLIIPRQTERYKFTIITTPSPKDDLMNLYQKLKGAYDISATIETHAYPLGTRSDLQRRLGLLKQGVTIFRTS